MLANRWEANYGMGKPLTIDEMIAHLQAIRKIEGNIACCFRNYDEELVIAPVTDTKVDNHQVVLESNDLPEFER
jgi:hypothetical protein